MKNTKSSGSLKRIRQGPAGTGLRLFFAVFPRGKRTFTGGWPSRWNHLLALKISLHQKGLNWAREGGNLDRDFIDE